MNETKIRTFIDFRDTWWWLRNHPAFFCKQKPGFKGSLDIHVAKVGPKTRTVDQNAGLNTATEVWLEAGSYIGDQASHDCDLDSGAETFEEAILEMAALVLKKYGDYSS